MQCFPQLEMLINLGHPVTAEHHFADGQRQAGPQIAAGMEPPEVAGLKTSLVKSATARASPIARAAVVLAVGANPRGQASRGTPTSITTSL